MKLKFDPNQQFQLDAVQAVVNVFDGQPLSKGDFEISFQSAAGPGYLASQTQTELGLGNQLILDEAQLRKNIRAVQLLNDIEPDLSFQGHHFSVEMETGTGKSYVYLRTIFELNRKYGFKKFIIVVPSVAIREGALKNLEVTAEHFKSLYNNVEYEYFVYDAKRINKLRHFASSNQIQILIINIDAFRKNFTGTEEERKSNVIYKESDRLSGRQPIEFVRATSPIVIIDEPQSVDNTEKAQEAIRALNPMCTLRYSATHRNPYHLVYKLDPIRAYEMRLVKQIVVASVMGAGGGNAAYVKLKKVEFGKEKRPSARMVIQIVAGGRVKDKEIKIKGGVDLYQLSGEREVYKQGFQVSEINAEPGEEFIEFDSGRRLYVGQETGGFQHVFWRMQIKNTIRRHLDKELQVRNRGIKVLSLFFIDRVANYRFYDEEGKPQKGKFAVAFEESFSELIKLERYNDLMPFPIEKLHDGYFAQDRKGVLKDTSGTTQADDEVYEKIMRNKEQLLSLDEPLRFIFSHSALREGWDNPNVFQICTLNESRSVIKKRQEIGRGLRIPVNEDGERVFDENINKLLVVANESYEEFAKSLQAEYEEDCGVTFGKVPVHAFSKLLMSDGNEAKLLGLDVSKSIFDSLKAQGILAEDGKILPAFEPSKSGFSLILPEQYEQLKNEVIEVLKSYQLERHIKKDEEQQKLKPKKQVLLDSEFKSLWDRIKVKTIYSVEFDTEELVRNAIKAIQGMDKIQPAKVLYNEAMINLEKKGISGHLAKETVAEVRYSGDIPDILAYLQNETELTRTTLVRILNGCGRLAEFFVNPQHFMDQISQLIKMELHSLVVDGIKYERLSGMVSETEWDMRLFEEKEVISYLNNRLEVKKSVYDAIVYDSQIEKEFAEAMERNDSIKLFVKLPDWFVVDTPIGKYNPDWAILKHDHNVLYLVRETKGTKNFESLRTTEAEKIKCGRKHFQELGVDFAVVTSPLEL